MSPQAAQLMRATEGGARDREPAAAGQLQGLVAPSTRVRRGRAGLFGDALRLLGPLLLLGFWALASALGWIEEQMLAPPHKVLRTAIDLLRSGVLATNLGASLKRALSGLALGVSTGLLLGVLTGLTRLADRLLDPVLQMLRTVPFLAVAPLLVLWFGIGEQEKLLLIAIATCFPFYLNTHAGVQSADRKLLEAAQVFGLSRFGQIRQIILPAALPHMLVGLRQSLGASLIALIVAEQTNAPKGIGFLMLSASQFFQAEVLLVCILLYGLWGLAADLLVRVLARVLMPWRRARAGGRRTPAQPVRAVRWRERARS